MKTLITLSAVLVLGLSPQTSPPSSQEPSAPDVASLDEVYDTREQLSAQYSASNDQLGELMLVLAQEGLRSGIMELRWTGQQVAVSLTDTDVPGSTEVARKWKACQEQVSALRTAHSYIWATPKYEPLPNPWQATETASEVQSIADRAVSQIELTMNRLMEDLGIDPALMHSHLDPEKELARLNKVGQLLASSSSEVDRFREASPNLLKSR